MRKALLLLSVLWLSGVAVSAQIVETPVPGDPVAIDSGLVSGKVLPSSVKAYLGVPFAAPPVRELRWRDQQPVEPWQGLYHADRKPSMCMQQMRGHTLNHYFGEEAASEDCLYLNLWAPSAARAGEKRPVLVFIYGGNFTQGTATLEAGEQSGLQLQAALKRASLSELRQLPADVIYAAQRAPGAPRFQPVVDRHLLPAMPNQLFAEGRQNDVPAMLGYMRDESSSSLRTAKSAAEYTAAARQMFGSAADAFLALYPVASDAEVVSVGARAAREAGMKSTMRAWARAQARTGTAPVYVNQFSRVHPYTPGVIFADHDPKTVGAYHTGEVPYWFQTQDAYNIFRTTRNWTPWDRELSEKLSDALIAFAETGNPNTPAIVWPRYDPANEQMMEFGDAIRTLRMHTAGLDFFFANPATARPPR